MGCSALSNGPVGFATSFSDGGGDSVGDGLLHQDILRDAGRAFPHPIRALTEASLRCRQPCAAVAAQIYCSLPCLHSELTPYGAEAGETMLGTAGAGLGGGAGAGAFAACSV